MITTFESVMATIRPLIAFNYHQLGSCKNLHARGNWNTEFSNSPSFAIIDSGPIETIINISISGG